MRFTSSKNPKRSEAGATLIEISIALGVGAIVLYFVSSMLWNTRKETASLTAKNDFNDFGNELQAFFNNPTRCQAAFLGQTSATPNKTNVPDLGTLGAPGAGTQPVPITLDMGNTAKGGVDVIAAGGQIGNDLTIISFEFTGKTASSLNSASNAVANQYEIPLRLVASRRLGGYATHTETETGTSTSTSTETSTATSTATDTATGAILVTKVGAKKASQTAIGGDMLQKTFILRVTMDAKGKFITGCAGQSNALWKIAPSGKLDIIFTGMNGKGQGSVGIGPDPGTGNFPDSSNCPWSTVTPAHPGPCNMLDVMGPTWADLYAYRSDARLKTNVRNIPHASDRIEKLHGVLFDWKNQEEQAGGIDQLGFLAQEVEEAFPEAVGTSSGSGLKSVAYENLIAPMIEAMKERQKILLQQERDLAEIRSALQKK